MIINDVVFTVGAVFFSLALMPTLLHVYHKRIGKEIVVTAAATSIALFVYCVNYASLGLWMAAIPHTATIWGIIAVLAWRNGDIKSSPST